MKTGSQDEFDADDEMRPEYDLSELGAGVRGKYRSSGAEPNGEALELNRAFEPDSSAAVGAKLNPSEARVFIARMDRELSPLFSKCVLPIFAEQDGVAIQCGTGTLFRVAGVSFLASASHVTDLAAKHHMQLYVSDAVPGARGLPLEGNPHSERNLDVSVWELTRALVESLPNRTFLAAPHADHADSRPRRGWYYVHGFPNCWSNSDREEKKAITKPWTHGTALYDGPTDRFTEYDPHVHVLLAAPSMGNVDSKGVETVMPKSLKGISGCSIWQAYYAGLNSKHWTVNDATLSAVETGTYLNGTVIRGTRWWVVDQIVAKNYPHFSHLGVRQ